jgi:hypothetical protein
MALFEAGVAVPGHGFTPREQLVDEPWGELSRVEHSDGRRLILVACTTVEGGPTDATTSVLKLLEEKDHKGSTDGLQEADVRSTGHGATHIVQAHLRDQGGRKFDVGTVFPQQHENSRWVTNGVFFKRHWA